MRVLFVPLHNGGMPHCGPLIALARMCAADSIETAFLLPRTSHAVGTAAGINVLNIDHQNTMRSELEAYRQFRPDVIVDDCSITTHYAAAVWGVPRVAIVRTGTFEGYQPRNAQHRFSLRIDLKQQETEFSRSLNMAPLEKVADYFRGSLYLVPGIRTIERLPAALETRTDHVFTGPLLLEDPCVERIVNATEPRAMTRTNVERFCEAQHDRPLAFFTFGNVHAPTPEIRECMRRLLARGVAVVSTIRLEEPLGPEREIYHHASYVPMHYLSGRANLMVHQCGSATYQYGLVHATRTITVGSRCFDRDDVAARLEELGVSHHLQDPAEEPEFVDTFMTLAERGLADEGRTERLARVQALNEEIERTRAAFRCGESLRALLARSRQPRARTVNAYAKRG